MFILPLGLQVHTQQFPWATTLIVVVTVFYSVLWFPKLDQMTQELITSPATLQVENEIIALALRHCLELSLEEKTCQKLSEARRKGDISKTIFFQSLNGVSKEDAKQIIGWVFRPSGFKKHLTDKSLSLNTSAFQLAYGLYLQAREERFQKQALLSRNTQSFLSLLHGQVLHGGWMHLLGNMFFLFAFAVAVEQRMGAGGLFGLYLFTGLVGLYASSSWMLPGVQLLGASAAVFGVAGAFCVFFGREKIRVLLTLIIYNRIIAIPVLWFFAFFVLSSELAGQLGSASGVAHDAHLSAFVVGGVLAYAYQKYRPVEQGFVFPEHFDLFQSALASGRPQRQMKKLASLHRQGVSHPLVRNKLWALSAIEKHPQSGEFLAYYRREILPEEFNQRLQDKDYAWFRQIPQDWDLGKEIKSCDPQVLTQAADIWVEKDQSQVSLRLYKLYLALNPTSSRAHAIRKTITNIENSRREQRHG